MVSSVLIRRDEAEEENIDGEAEDEQLTEPRANQNEWQQVDEAGKEMLFG
uniref:Uncharacterized protein n=1 Tax=Kalanchoe fedtschenkoi TaxID=63787 RepID=A0A7N0U2Y3_KALFE